MCGRYYIEIDEKDLQEICDEVERNTNQLPGQISFKMSGEIFPTDIVPVQTGVNKYEAMKWGFWGINNKPLINARSESVLEKPTFRQSMLDHRCLIPASGYYEWKKVGTEKQKYKFYLPNQPIYLAGCFRQEKDNPLCSFVIITKDAACGLEEIHPRMPVIIPEKHIADWFEVGMNVLNTAVDRLEFTAV